MGKWDDEDFRNAQESDPYPDSSGSDGLSLKEALLGVLKPMASLRLTVILFSLAFFLVFCGTLAQVDYSNWTVVKGYFRSLWVQIPFQVFLRFAQTFFNVSKSADWPGSVPFPGGRLLGFALLINVLAAHIVRFKFTWKRSGILILHAGLIVMMVGELVTGIYAVEGNMTIPIGKSSNYLEVRNGSELAVIDPSDPETDDVVVVPGWILRKGGLISDSHLPFDIKVDKYMVNSTLAKETPRGMDNPATTGAGLQRVAIEKKEGTGVSSNQRVDLASAYVTFQKKGSDESLGTYLTSMFLPDQEVSLDGKTYRVNLRFKRVYKPYTVHLKEFHHDTYMGTDMAKNFSSLVRLEDPSRNEEREFNISMNNPMRHAGETFYQSEVLGEDQGTVLQVVENPAVKLPYISCIMVAMGMIIHFGIHLWKYLKSNDRAMQTFRRIMQVIRIMKFLGGPIHS